MSQDLAPLLIGMKRPRRCNVPDAYYWPLTVVICLLVGSVAGLVLATKELVHPRAVWQGGWSVLVQSGWLHLAADVGLLVVLLVSGLLLRGAVLRRVQMCVLLSILGHLWLAVYLYAQALPVDLSLDEKVQRVELSQELAAMPDYHWDWIDQPVDAPPSESFEQPVPLSLPKPAEAAKIERANVDPEIAPAQPVPEPRADEAPDAVDVKRAELPPAIDEPSPQSRLARQSLDAPLEAAIPIPEPEIRPARPAAPEEIVSPAASVERRPETPRGVGRGSAPNDEPPLGVGPAAIADRRGPMAPQAALPAAEASNLRPPRKSPLAVKIEMPRIEEPEVMDSPSDLGPPVAVLREPSTTVGRRSLSAAEIAALALRQHGGSAEGTTAPAIPEPTAARDAIPRLRDQLETMGGAGGSASLPRATLLPEASPSETVASPIPLPPATGEGSGSGPTLRAPDAAKNTELAGPNVGMAGPALRVDATPGLPDVGAGTAAAIGGGIAGLPGGLARGAGTLPPLGGAGSDSRKFFEQRKPERRGKVAEAFGGTQQTEQAVERGIDFLVRHQFPDGRWCLDRYVQGGEAGYEDASPGQMNADTAATGMALLSFLGAGYTHESGKHQKSVRRGLAWLLANQQRDGRLFSAATDRTRYAQSYGHAIATISLCEAYGMTRDPSLRAPAERAVAFILASQHPERGGWRYEPRRESDTSVSGWKLMALKSAQMAGLPVPPESLEKVSHWLDLAQSAGGSRYAYNPYAADTPQQRDGRVPNLAMTAEGLLMRMWLGWDRSHPALAEGARLLAAHPPENGTADQPLRDVYYWYYATQVMFQLQGEAWTQWNDRLRALLPSTQVREGPLTGSWHPASPAPDRWAQAAGRHYVTCLSLLMLEVHYRHLPLYRTSPP